MGGNIRDQKVDAELDGIRNNVQWIRRVLDDLDYDRHKDREKREEVEKGILEQAGNSGCELNHPMYRLTFAGKGCLLHKFPTLAQPQLG